MVYFIVTDKHREKLVKFGVMNMQNQAKMKVYKHQISNLRLL